MFRTTHTVRQTAAGLVLAAAIAALAAPSALGGSNSRFGAPDGWTTWAVSQTSPQHANAADGRSPDTRDAGLAAQQQALVARDGRSPDTVDATVLAHSPTVTVYRSAGFRWGDFGIGVAAALGAILLMLVLGTAARSARRRPGLRSA